MLLERAALYFDALGIAAPTSLIDRLGKARALYAQLLRPDGTLPSLGNTVRIFEGGGIEGRVSARSNRGVAVERTVRWTGPTSGLLVWWSMDPTVPGDDRLSQTVVTWANFATRAHKHVDEMSLFVWTNKSDILIGSGYWPYGSPYEKDATGWAGANAPHFSSEAPEDRGETRLLALASSDNFEFAELERTGRRGGRIQRQILHVRPDLWFVIDTPSSSEADTLQSTWTFDPGLTVLPKSADSLEIHSTTGLVAQVRFGECRNGTWRLTKGSEAPFAGWTAADGRIVPAPAVIRRCPAGESAVFILDTAQPGQRTSDVTLTRFVAPDDWTVSLGAEATAIASRHASQIRSFLPRCRGDCELVAITSVPSSDGAAEIDRSFRTLSEKYTRHQEGWRRYRVKISWALVIAWIGLLAVLAILGLVLRRNGLSLISIVSATALAGWVGLALWLHLVYFQ
ncbi:MAG: hypothetical protein HC801_13130 [Nitrospira sp.]|nr:hypothetical protein [Nitrospira sp.]